MKRSLPYCIAGALALIAVPFALFTQPKITGSVTATYAHGTLRVNIPYEAPRSGAGKLTIEVLDPEDGIDGRISRRVYAASGKGFAPQDLALPATPAVDDLVWHRLRYRFAYDDDRADALDGVTSISRILRRASVHVLGQQSYVSGGEAAVRIVVTEGGTENPVTSGSVRIALTQPGQETRTLYTGRLNERGTTPAHFRFPAGVTGSYSLRYAVDTAIGPVEYTQNIRLEDKSSILLTTEKPVYQPGQTIHARALALDRSTHQATAGRGLTFEVEDSRGNKVFRKATQTDAYGIASAEFGLADEVNLGAYHLRALMDAGGEGAQNRAEIALRVERYVLPKFKVAVDLGNDNARAKRGYRPGGHVTGTVRANYFFGKPVDGAEVAVTASGMDVARFEAGNARGKTDRDGSFRFDVRLPDFFAGRAANHGAAQVLIEASVKDGAGHSESGGEPVTVSESPLLITAVPEGGTLIPGLENQVFVLTSYADGTPAQAEVRIHAAGSADRSASTDAGGVAVIPVQGSPGSTTLQVTAADREGNRVSIPVTLEGRVGSDQVQLRSEKAVYRAGERIRLNAFSTRKSGSVYLDVVREGQTIATHDLDMANGRADFEFTATPEMAGTVDLNATVFGRDARPVSDHRLIFVQPADELKIETAVDAPVHKPGDEARVSFRVTNGKGEGVQAALGLEVVDQAVFALAEKQPGFAKVFFYLEQETMKPRYEIHSIGLPETITSVEPAETARRDRAARALFAATELVTTNNAAFDFGADVPRTKYSEYAARYQKRLRTQVDRFAGTLARAYAKGSETCGLTEMQARVKDANLVDAWGNGVRVNWNSWASSFTVLSAGPDGQLFTGDELAQTVQDRYCSEPTVWGSQNVALRFEHNRGPANGRAQVAGTVREATGATVPHATIRVTEIGSGKVRDVKADAAGRFVLNDLDAGRYRIDLSVPGFQAAAREFSLKARDRAIADVVLRIGPVSETVEVTAMAPMLAPRSVAGAAESFFVNGAVRDKDVAMNVRAKAGPAIPAAAEDAHVRSWFPESLYVAPEIITDKDGRASIAIPIADNITTWRMAMLASTKQGALGRGTSSLKVFQDFFTEVDLPVTLTQGDEVSIPVAVYNYSGARGDVRLRLEEADWFSLDGDVPEKSVAAEAGRVSGSQFTIAAKRIGKFRLTLRAEMEGAAKRADIVVREIEVVPNGREQNMVFNGRLDSSVRQAVNFPATAIPDASTVFVRLYPGPLSQVVEGMDSLLRMPFGCFEQTSSSTYPNVLALDYMKRTKKLTPEVSAKAQGYIATGYQRLVTFEVPGGGFSWFGRAPANKILTSYGLMEFSDMSKVHDVDPNVIQRTQQWLAGQQQADGSWRPDSGGINEGATDHFRSDILRITAYVAWALEATGYRGTAVDRARQYVESDTGPADAYTLAVLANFAVDDGKDRAFTDRAMRTLLDARAEHGDQVSWQAEQTGLYASGRSAAVETTGLAVQALLKWGGEPAVAAKAMNFIVANKDGAGTWGTTQATIMALRALLLSTGRGGGTAQGTVEVLLNGQVAKTLALTAENDDLFQQFVFKGSDAQQANRVEIRFTGQGLLAYQIAGRYFVPWNEKPAGEALSIDVGYDRTRLEEDQVATATATVRNRLGTTANMVMVDLGIPPGFELLSEDLDAYREKSAGKKSGRLEKFSLTPTQAILYFNSIGPRDELKVPFRLRAKHPIRARTFASRVYEYYDPEVSSLARPVQLEVRKR